MVEINGVKYVPLEVNPSGFILDFSLGNNQLLIKATIEEIEMEEAIKIVDEIAPGWKD